MTLRAKYGVWLTRKRNCYSEMGRAPRGIVTWVPMHPQCFQEADTAL